MTGRTMNADITSADLAWQTWERLAAQACHPVTLVKIGTIHSVRASTYGEDPRVWAKGQDENKEVT